ncbi:MAG TPA: YerC/YecD family TrpR-related protein [Anaerovoracaceae bacterium]|nr:YerC/YecD family TrpR-related protein [Anaerovoracaceae bacterium]
MEYESKLKSKETDELFEGILLLETKEECYRFFDDVCTIKELQALAQRFQVANLLEKKRTYSEIEEITKASTATISRVNRCLVYGADGYKLVFKKLKQSRSESAGK